MPFGNRMGPQGMGPMTGRGAGHCAGYGIPGSMNRFSYKMPGTATEKEILALRAGTLEAELAGLKKRLAELETEPKS